MTVIRQAELSQCLQILFVFKSGGDKKVDKYVTNLMDSPLFPDRKVYLSRSAKAVRGERGLESSVLPFVKYIDLHSSILPDLK